MKKSLSTRLSILQKSFELIYAHGYQATSIDTIIATTNVTKGAFFYHFKNKDEMGLAVINEIMYPLMHDDLVRPLLDSVNPAEDIYKMMHYLLLENSFLNMKDGCPAGNLTQEMSPLNEDFRQALSKLSEAYKNAMKVAIENGQKNGVLKQDIQSDQVAVFVLSGYWGIRTYGKVASDNNCYNVYLEELKVYLNDLLKK
jgi:TetR/AcrR family transcriptional regulator, transcriptional repressor for nem operon